MSAPAIPLAGGTLDRAAARRLDAGWLDAARSDPAARAVLAGARGVAVETVPLGDHEPLAFLGVEDDGAPLFLVDAPEDAPVQDLRTQAATGDPAVAGLLAYASHLRHFRHTHRFCGSCGEPTAPVDGGHAVRCPNGHQHHPRTDPVVIMLVTDGTERILMGRQPAWPERRYSALAGFVEPGEAIETAVAREVREEAGVEIGAVRFVASQPWPFPASLMLGFEAEFAAGAPAPQDDELEDVRWFARAEVAAAAAHDVDFDPRSAQPGTGLILPPTLAIARHLVDGWLARTAP